MIHKSETAFLLLAVAGYLDTSSESVMILVARDPRWLGDVLKIHQLIYYEVGHHLELPSKKPYPIYEQMVRWKVKRSKMIKQKASDVKFLRIRIPGSREYLPLRQHHPHSPSTRQPKKKGMRSVSPVI